MSEKDFVSRLDGFFSALTGVGNRQKDPAKGHRYILDQNDFKSQQEIEGLYYKEGLAARIVEVLPKEMLKKGKAAK